jgi:hypothetical protein
LGQYDMILHVGREIDYYLLLLLYVGDMAYDLDTRDALFGDQFMRQIEPIAAYVPYTVIVGNHEQAYNFSNYVARFTMDKSVSNHYFR